MQAKAKPVIFEKTVIPIIPYNVKGRYRNIKNLILIFAYAMYFSIPWLTWHGALRTGQPILIDLNTLRMNLFDLVIFPHDLIILVGILILAVMLLFMMASLYGRLFCGFFCFQTLWTDAFRFIERMIQGEAQARLRLRKQPWGLKKIAKLGSTHMLWLLLSFATALTFPLYFLEAPVLFAKVFNGSAPAAAYITIITLTLSTYVAAGLAREQICLVACPYGRFQTAMQDQNTKTIVYDQNRGERALGRIAPGSALKSASVRAEKGYGDCIDCKYCLNVCPTGVDIRKGFQIDCISCGLCIDACNTIMDSMHLPRGLIRFGQSQSQNKEQEKRHFNKNVLGYSVVMASMLAFVIYTANTRTAFDVSVQHYRQPMFTQMSNGDIKNRYFVRITNKTTDAGQYSLHLQGVPEDALSGTTQYLVPAGKTYTQTFNVVLPEKSARNTEKLKLILRQEGHPDRVKTFDITYYSGLSVKS